MQILLLPPHGQRLWQWPEAEAKFCRGWGSSSQHREITNIKEGEQPSRTTTRLYKRKKEEKKSGLTSSAEALLELSEFSFFPSASESLGRRNSEDCEDEEEEDIGRTCTQQETPLDTPCLLKDSYRGASFSAKEKGKHLVLENESQNFRRFFQNQVLQFRKCRCHFNTLKKLSKACINKEVLI